MGQDSTKPFFSNITSADVLMTIDVRAKPCFRIICVEYGDVFEAQNRV